MLILAVLLSLVAAGLFVHVLVKLTMREGFKHGLIGLIFPPYTFVWGWKKSKTENIRNAMIAWSGILVILALSVLVIILIN
jgi:hypothetical protein